MRFFTAAATALAIAGLSSPAHAADPPITNPSQIVDRVTVESVTQLITELGGQQIQVIDGGGTKVVTFQDGGTPYNLTPTGCNQGVCTGLSLLVVVENPPTGMASETLVTAAKDNPLLSFFKVDAGKFAVGRISLVNGGVTKKHLAIEIALFVAAYREAVQKLSTQLIARGPDPFQRAGFGQTGPLRAIRVAPALVTQLAGSLPREVRVDLRR